MSSGDTPSEQTVFVAKAIYGALCGTRRLWGDLLLEERELYYKAARQALGAAAVMRAKSS